MDHYRRLSANTGAVDGRAPRLANWYDRLHSEELVMLMAEVGINLAVTHFFKGFGLQHEHQEQQRTADLVHLAHKYGVRVLGYCQSRSLYYETFLAEEPNAEAWIQRDSLGRPRIWSGAYYRWAPCVLSQDFRDYMKRVIRFGLEEIKLDGLHFDNCYALPCYCERCEKAFKVWLRAHYPSPRERFGFSTFDHVRQPPERESPGSIHDPLIQAWVRFRCEALADYLGELTTYARSVDPGVITMGNPAYPRNPYAAHDLSVWPPLVGKQLDLMFAENGQFPGMKDGMLISQVRAYKQGTAVGYRVASTTWQQGVTNPWGLPETTEAVALQIAEAAANGGVPGSNWALRSLGEDDRMRIDRADLRQPLEQYLSFVEAQGERLQGATPAKDVAILRSFAAENYDAAQTARCLYGTEESLLRGGISWEVLFTEDLGRLADFSVVVLPGLSHLDDEECAAIRAYAEAGGALLFIGDNGLRDERGYERAEDPFADLTGEEIVRLPREAATVEVQIGASTKIPTRVPLPDGWQQIVAAVVQVAPQGLVAQLCGSTEVTLSAWRLPAGGLAAHLVNYAAPRPATDLCLYVAQPGEVFMRTPDAPERKLEIQTFANEQHLIKIPQFALYAVIVVDNQVV
jgi:hypothetical protein